MQKRVRVASFGFFSPFIRHNLIQTVQKAYEQLLSEGYIYSAERSGYFISEYNGDWCHIVVIEKSQSII